VTAVKVVDASAIAALVFGEPAAEEIAVRLTGARLAAPTLIFFELANVVVTKLRRHRVQRQELLAAYALVAELAIDSVDTDLDETVLLAETTGLTAYDASYLWLARKLGVELVTLDTRLAAASIT
jgi:predicted nucleic acid-binding protein